MVLNLYLDTAEEPGWATSLISALHGNGKNAAKRNNPPRPTGFLMAAAEPNETKRGLPATKLKASSTSTG
jgi:hypothetical protein